MEGEITFETVVSVLSRFFYGDAAGWFCPFCRQNFVEVAGEKEIREAIESNGYCSSCREGCNSADNWEKQQLEEANRAQVNCATGWTDYDSGSSPFFDEEQNA